MEKANDRIGYRRRLLNELVSRQRKNSAYSLRSFARDLGLSPATLSQLLNEKRQISKKNLLKVSTYLGFSPLETESALRELVGKPTFIEDEHYSPLSDDVFRYMSDWYYFAILSLSNSGEAKADPNWIAQRLNITIFQAKDAVLRLKRLGLIKTTKGFIRLSKSAFRVPSDVPSAAARHLQHDHLRLADASLESHPIHLRDMTSMTMLASVDRIPTAKRMIKNFRRRLARHLEVYGPDQEVYVLGVQLFPVSQRAAK